MLVATLAVFASCGEDLPTGAVSYVSIQTEHFVITFPEGNERYHDGVALFLERAYGLYQRYSGQDLNTLSHKWRYEFGYRQDDWHWGTYRMGDYGGLSIAGGPSAVRSVYVPESLLPVSASPNNFVAFSLHELGNGWWQLLDNSAGVSPLPWWFNDEGHSGFLRSSAELDMGYCADAREQYAAHYADFYVKCKQGGGSHCGVETRLVSLQHKYGWAPFRRLYAAIQSGSLDYLLSKSDVEKNGAVAVLLSEAVGQSLLDFLARDGIQVDAASKVKLNRLPRADVPMLSSLPCR
jgi:hypothetical protein